jgi:hypothetical protein
MEPQYAVSAQVSGFPDGCVLQQRPLHWRRTSTLQRGHRYHSRRPHSVPMTTLDQPKGQQATSLCSLGAAVKRRKLLAACAICYQTSAETPYRGAKLHPQTQDFFSLCEPPGRV